MKDLALLVGQQREQQVYLLVFFRQARSEPKRYKLHLHGTYPSLSSNEKSQTRWSRAWDVSVEACVASMPPTLLKLCALTSSIASSEWIVNRHSTVNVQQEPCFFNCGV